MFSITTLWYETGAASKVTDDFGPLVASPQASWNSYGLLGLSNQSPDFKTLRETYHLLDLSCNFNALKKRNR